MNEQGAGKALDYRIRRAGVQDAQGISDLLLSVSQAFVLDEFTQAARRRYLDDLAPQCLIERLQGAFAFYLAETETALAGVIALRDNAHVYYLFVAGAYQRCGVARALWQRARDEAQGAGNPGVFSVNASRYSVPAYTRMGFVAQADRQERAGIPYYPMSYGLTV